MKSIAEIPEGWEVVQADFECGEPWVIAVGDDITGEDKFAVPKSLAYWLVTHYAGCKALRDTIKRQVQSDIRKAVGLP